jgi:hypothetical protein
MVQSHVLPATEMLLTVVSSSEFSQTTCQCLSLRFAACGCQQTAVKHQKRRLTVSRAFSICSLWPRRLLRISAPYVSVSNAIRVESSSRLFPSSRTSVPANNRVRSPRSPYGSSDVPALPRALVPPRRSVRAACAWDSLDIFLYLVSSALVCLSLVVY